MKKKDEALLIGGTLTGMALVANALAIGYIKENFVRKIKKIKPGKIESVDEMHIDYLRRKSLAWIKEQRVEDIEITSKDGLTLCGQYIINGDVDRTEDEPVNIVLLSHGYGGTGYKDMLIFADFYRKQGYDIMLIDQRAHGKSEGTAISFGALEKDDCTRWVKKVIERHDGNCRILMHGWSMGAAIIYLAAAGGLPPQVRGLVYDCGYSVAEAEFLHVSQNMVPLPKVLLWYIIQFMKPWCRILCGFDMKDSSPLFVAHNMKLPVFFVHGTTDSCVPVWMGRRMYKATDRTTYRDLLLVENADHTYSYIHDKDGYEAGVLKLMDKCMQ